MDEQLRQFLLTLSDTMQQFAGSFDTFAAKARRAELIGAGDKLAAMIASGQSFPPGSGLDHLTPSQAALTLQAIGAMLTATSTNGWDRAIVSFLRTP